MQIGHCYLQMDTLGNTVPKSRVTPAEVSVLIRGFQGAANGNPIKHLVVTGEEKRDHRKELRRLNSAYTALRSDHGKTKVVTEMYPGNSVRLPETFAEVEVDGITVTATHGKAPPAEWAPTFGDEEDTVEEFSATGELVIKEDRGKK